MRYEAEFAADLVWYIHDLERGDMAAILDDRYSDRPRTAEKLKADALAMTAGLNAARP